jgi:hypothetical protein
LRRNGNDHNNNDSNDHTTTTTTTTADGGGAGGGGVAMDLGLISFLGTGLSASCLLRKLSSLSSSAAAAARHRRAHRHAPPGRCLRAFAVLTQLTVAANYVLGTIFAFTAGKRVYVYFATYCIVFSIIWIAAAYVGWAIGGLYNEAAIREYGGREEEDDAQSRGRSSSSSSSSIGRQQLPGPLMALMSNIMTRTTFAVLLI